MAIANVALIDTFEDWQQIINQTVVTVNQLDSNPEVAQAAWNTANAAYEEANAHVSLTGYAVNTTVDIVWTTANTSYDQANAAFDQANAAFNQANSSFDQANTSYNQANAAFDQANSAFDAVNAIATFDQDLNTTNSVSFSSVSTNTVTIDQGVQEKFSAKSGATGTVTHDCSNGQIFYHTSPSANFTANFTNLTLESGRATSLTLVIDQGGTGYIANNIQIGGSAQTINWSSNTEPTANTNSVDVMSFSVLNNSGTFVVLGQLSTFG